MRWTTGVRAVLIGLALGVAPLLAAPAAHDGAGAALPGLEVTMRDDAVAGLPGVIPAGRTVLQVTNAGSSERSLVVARLHGEELRVVARTAALAPGRRAAVVVRFAPGRWLAAEGGVSRGPAAATLVPSPAAGAPR